MNGLTLAVAATLPLLGGGTAAAAGTGDRIELGRIPLAVAAGADAVWVSSAGVPTGILLRIDPRNARVAGRVPVGRTPVAIAVANGQVWVANGIGGSTRPKAPGENTVMRIDPRRDRVVATIPVRDPESIAAGLGAVWVGRPGSGVGGIVRIDPRRNRVTATLRVPADGPVEVATGFGSLWALAPRIRAGEPSRSTLFRIDGRTRAITARIPVGGSSDDLAVGETGVWIRTDAGVVEVDPRTNRPVGRLVAVRAGDVAAGAGAVWVTGASGTVRRIDPLRRRVVGPAIEVGASADELAAGPDAVWVTDSRDRSLVRISAGAGRRRRSRS